MPTSRGVDAVTTSFAFLAIAGATVSTRVCVRLFLVQRWGADDALVICSLILSIALTITIKKQEQYGLGSHFDSLAPGEFTQMLKFFWASLIVYNGALTFVKCSILCQFLRFFIYNQPRTICLCIIAVVVAYGIVVLFGTVFICTPLSYFWDKSIKNGHCIDLMAFWFAHASFNILTDLAICILPIPVLKLLSLPRKQKYIIIAVFVVGGFGCITSILRLHSIYVISRSTDVTWDNVGAATWSSVEVNVGIVCACLPALKPLVGVVWPRYNRSMTSLPAVMIQNDTYVRKYAGRDTVEADQYIATHNSTGHSADTDVEGVWEGDPHGGMIADYHVEDAWDGRDSRATSSASLKHLSKTSTVITDFCVRGDQREAREEVSEMG